MIIDRLCESKSYEKLHPLFKQAFDYIKSKDFLHIEPDKHILEEDALIVMINDATLKPQEKARLEIHDRFIDIHIPLSQTEHFAWLSRDLLKNEAEPFNLDKDAQHFLDKPSTYFELDPGNFAIFFPNDAHVGCIGEGSIRKIVIKVRV